MHGRRCAADRAPIDHPDCLVPEADAEDRHARPEVPDHVDRDPRSLRPTGPWGDQDLFGCHGLDFANGDLVVTAYADLRPELAEVLHEVVGERIVVIDDKDHVAAIHLNYRLQLQTSKSKLQTSSSSPSLWSLWFGVCDFS